MIGNPIVTELRSKNPQEASTDIHSFQLWSNYRQAPSHSQTQKSSFLLTTSTEDRAGECPRQVVTGPCVQFWLCFTRPTFQGSGSWKQKTLVSWHACISGILDYRRFLFLLNKRIQNLSVIWFAIHDFFSVWFSLKELKNKW